MFFEMNLIEIEWEKRNRKYKATVSCTANKTVVSVSFFENFNTVGL